MYHSFDTEIAAKYGLVEAIILNNLFFWIKKNEANEENYFDGEYWTYNSVKAYSLLFPYLTEKVIRRALKNLIDEGIIKTGNYNANPYDRTMWYAFTEKGKSIYPKGQMEMTERANENVQKGKCIITDNKPDNKPYNNKKNPKASELDSMIDEYTNNPALSDTLRDYIKLRKALKSPLTDRAMKICLNKLDTLATTDEGKIKVVEQSIERGWKGLFPLKQQEQEPVRDIHNLPDEELSEIERIFKRCSYGSDE